MGDEESTSSPQLLVAAVDGSHSGWFTPMTSAEVLRARLVEEFGPASGAVTWTVSATRGLFGVAPSRGWSLELACAVAHGIAVHGETFARWTEAIPVEEFEETPDEIIDVFSDTLFASSRDLASLAGEDIAERGGLGALERTELEQYFDFEAYARSLLDGSERFIVETSDGVSMFEEWWLPDPDAGLEACL